MWVRQPILFYHRRPSSLISSRSTISRLASDGRARCWYPSLKVLVHRGGHGDVVTGIRDSVAFASATICPWQATISRSFSSNVNIDYQSFLEQHPDKVVLSFITDIEGDKFYLDRYVETSKVLTFIPREPEYRCFSVATPSSRWTSCDINDDDDHLFPFPYDHCIDFSTPNSMLIFGGDLWDKGGYDLYVARQILDLKRRYPHRVLWVLGNRDIGKIRMMQELGLPGRPIPYHPGTTWLQKTGLVGDPEGPLPPMDPGGRLQWILAQTMGSSKGMDHRRHELAWERELHRHRFEHRNGDEKNNDVAISDEDVVRSYRETCHPRGEMGHFLSQGHLALTIGPVLFIHGSLPLTREVIAEAKSKSQSVWDDLTFALPWLLPQCNDDEGASLVGPSLHSPVKSIEDWIVALNQFCYHNVKEWKSSIAKLEEDETTDLGQKNERCKDLMFSYRPGYHSGPPYSSLMQYGLALLGDENQKVKNPTVVCCSFTPGGMPKPFLRDKYDSNVDQQQQQQEFQQQQQQQHELDVATCIREYFDRAPIQLIMTGHKPQGDMPTTIKVDDKAWVVCADTSYSGDTVWWHDDDDGVCDRVVGDNDGDGRTGCTSSPGKRGNLGRGGARSYRGDVAVSEVLVELSGSGQCLDSVHCHGVLSDGTEYHTLNLLDPSVSHNTSIGQVAPDHLVPAVSESPHRGRWWTKSIFRDGSHLFYAGEGYNVWNYIVKGPAAAAAAAVSQIIATSNAASTR